MPVITPEKWRQFIGAIAGGAKIDDALFDIDLSKTIYSRMMKAEPKLAQQVDEARKAAARIGWDDDTIDLILTDIAMGDMVKTAVFTQGKELSEFYNLILKDPEIKERYDTARKIHLEGMIDEMLTEAANDVDDKTWDGKGNSAAVNRSRLQIETRQWLMERLHRQRFAPKVQEQEVHIHVNHVEKLESARRRSEARVVKTVEKATPIGRFPRQ